MLQVIVLHGIWNSRGWLLPLASRLRREGFAPHLFGYRSVFAGPQAAVTALLRQIDALGDAPVALVGHSLGGLVAMQALQHGARVQRVVCLGSPLLGSAAARELCRYPGAGWLLGHSRRILLDGVAPWGGSTAVGMIAGNRAHGLGRLFAQLGDCDGTVSVAETRLPGLADHCVLPLSHTGLAVSAAAVRQTAAFLRHGKIAVN